MISQAVASTTGTRWGCSGRKYRIKYLTTLQYIPPLRCAFSSANMQSAHCHTAHAQTCTCGWHACTTNRKFISHRADSALTMNYFRNKQSLWERIFLLWNSHGKGTILLWKIVSLSGLSLLYELINEDCMCQLAKQCYSHSAESYFCEPSITKTFTELHLLLV